MRFSTAAVIAFIAYTSTQAFAAPVPVNINSLETRGWLQKRELQEIEARHRHLHPSHLIHKVHEWLKGRLHGHGPHNHHDQQQNSGGNGGNGNPDPTSSSPNPNGGGDGNLNPNSNSDGGGGGGGNDNQGDVAKRNLEGIEARGLAIEELD